MNEKLYVLGTGNAQALNCYNTCFAFGCGEEADREYLLVDAGGGNGILRVLRDAGIPLARVRRMIVTHEHTDHVLGVVWVVRMIATAMLAGKYEGEFPIYAHEELCEIIRTLCRLTLQKKHFALVGGRIPLIPVADGETRGLGPYTVRFFDIRSTKAKQFGFATTLRNGRRLCCLGDEPYNPACREYAEGADWLLSEAFCLYADREIFKPYEKNHSTVRDAAELGRELGAARLVLWHTEDSGLDTRKARYTAEAAEVFDGGIFVPDDGDVIEL